MASQRENRIGERNCKDAPIWTVEQPQPGVEWIEQTHEGVLPAPVTPGSTPAMSNDNHNHYAARYLTAAILSRLSPSGSFVGPLMRTSETTLGLLVVPGSDNGNPPAIATEGYEVLFIHPGFEGVWTRLEPNGPRPNNAVLTGFKKNDRVVLIGKHPDVGIGMICSERGNDGRLRWEFYSYIGATPYTCNPDPGFQVLCLVKQNQNGGG